MNFPVRCSGTMAVGATGTAAFPLGDPARGLPKAAENKEKGSTENNDNDNTLQHKMFSLYCAGDVLKVTSAYQRILLPI